MLSLSRAQGQSAATQLIFPSLGLEAVCTAAFWLVILHKFAHFQLCSGLGSLFSKRTTVQRQAAHLVLLCNAGRVRWEQTWCTCQAVSASLVR